MKHEKAKNWMMIKCRTETDLHRDEIVLEAVSNDNRLSTEEAEQIILHVAEFTDL
jgi:hypothetical protein